MISSHPFLPHISEETLYKMLNPIFPTFPTPYESRQKMYQVISLALTCKAFYHKIHSYAFSQLLRDHLHPFFLPKTKEDKFSWKEWRQFNRWQCEEKGPQMTHRTLKTTFREQFAFCDDQGELTICGNHNNVLQKISGTKGPEDIFTISSPGAKYRSIYACSEQFIAVLNSYTTLDIIRLYCLKTNVFLRPLLFERASVCQIEMEGENLYVMTIDKENKNQKLLCYSLTSNKQEEQKIIKQRILISFIKQFYLCSQYIFLLEQGKKGHYDGVSGLWKTGFESCSYQGRVLFYRLPLENRQAKFIQGDHSLFYILKKGLSLQINRIKLDLEGFHQSRKEFILEKTFENATIRTVYYHLEKIFIYFSNHDLLVCDHHSQKNHMLRYFTLPSPLSADCKLHPVIYSSQIIATSFKVHCLSLFDFQGEQEEPTAQVFTLDYTQTS